MSGRPATPILDRVMAKVAPSDTGCLIFTGDRHTHGYGRIRSSSFPYRGLLTHRVVWEAHNGPIPDGYGVYHRCDTPPCVNVAHLFLGLPGDNMTDMAAKGRWANQHQRGPAWNGGSK